MRGFVLGLVVAVLINLSTALFSRQRALALIPWLSLYVIAHGFVVLLNSSVVRDFALPIARRCPQKWSYLFVMALFAVLAGVAWKGILSATDKLAQITETAASQPPDTVNPPPATPQPTADPELQKQLMGIGWPIVIPIVPYGFGQDGLTLTVINKSKYNLYDVTFNICEAYAPGDTLALFEKKRKHAQEIHVGLIPPQSVVNTKALIYPRAPSTQYQIDATARNGTSTEMLTVTKGDEIWELSYVISKGADIVEKLPHKAFRSKEQP